MAYLPCDECGKITTHQGSWDTPIRILCKKCTKNKSEKILKTSFNLSEDLNFDLLNDEEFDSFI
jgi:hypothetical protein